MPRGPDTPGGAEQAAGAAAERAASGAEPSPPGRRLRVAVVGAGVAGLACARALADHGHEVVVLDKGRGPGGRTATRRASQAGRAQEGAAGRGPREPAADDPGASLLFDHGAQYLTARDPAFRRHVAAWAEAGVLAPWAGRVVVLREGALGPPRRDAPGSAAAGAPDADAAPATPGPQGALASSEAAARTAASTLPWRPEATGQVRGGSEPAGDPVRWVGVPGMSALCGHLARGLDVRCGLRVTALAREPAGTWALDLEDARGRAERASPGASAPEAAHGLLARGSPPPGARTGPAGAAGGFDAVVVTAPGPQAAELLRPVAPALAARAATIPHAPCWAVLLELAGPVAARDGAFDGAFVEGSPLAWVCRQASKPGRPATEAWVLHAGPAWSREHLEDAPEDVAPTLLRAFAAALDRPLPEVRSVVAHRWRYALPEPAPEPCLLDPDLLLGLAGDGLGGPRVEGAWLSGRALAGGLLDLPRARTASPADAAPAARRGPLG